MAAPLTVVVRRGRADEARHRIHAVAVADGKVVASVGVPGLVTYFRSSAKPLQALPTIRARPDLEDDEIAIACASHLHRPEQLDAVRSLLRRAGATEDDLECGPEPTPIEHNCSGKHASMLLLCRERAWPHDGYRLSGHPCQQQMAAVLGEATGLDMAAVPTAADGCGVVTYALALEDMARAFVRLPELEGGERVLAAMRACPDLVRGPGAADTELMRHGTGWAAKGGAEGLLCAVRDGLALAIKVEDGAQRPVRSGLAAFLELLGEDAGNLGDVPVTNSLGEVVGRVEAAPGAFAPLPQSSVPD